VLHNFANVHSPRFRASGVDINSISSKDYLLPNLGLKSNHYKSAIDADNYFRHSNRIFSLMAKTKRFILRTA
jgi:hypothetical protein